MTTAPSPSNDIATTDEKRSGLDAPHTKHEAGSNDTSHDHRSIASGPTGTPSSETHDDIPARSTFKSVCLVVTCTMAMIVNISNSTSVSIALPSIQRDLQIEEVQLKWIVSAYPLTSGCLLLLAGRLADLYGRKKLFTIGSVWMVAFTLCCAFAQNSITLDILRGMQGIGAAATIPASLGMLAHGFPPNSRARSLAFATFAAGAPVGGVLGLSLGGILTQFTAQKWRSAFYLTSGFSALCLIGCLVSFDPDRPSTEPDQRVDWIGAFTVTAGLVLIVFVLGEGESAPNKWGTPYIIALFILGVFFIVLFLFWQYYLEHVPVVEMDAPTTHEAVDMDKGGWAGSGNAVYSVFKLVFILGLELLGTIVLPELRWVHAYKNGRAVTVPLVYLIAFGTTMTGTAGLPFALIDPSAPYWSYGFPAAILSVVGADFVFAGGTIYIAKMSLPHEQSVSGAIFQTMTQLGTSLGVTISTVVFNRILVHESGKSGVVPNEAGTDAPRPAQLSAYKAAQWTNFAFGVFATLLGVMFLRGTGIVGHTKGK